MFSEDQGSSMEALTAIAAGEDTVMFFTDGGGYNFIEAEGDRVEFTWGAFGLFFEWELRDLEVPYERRGDRVVISRNVLRNAFGMCSLTYRNH